MTTLRPYFHLYSQQHSHLYLRPRRHLWARRVRTTAALLALAAMLLSSLLFPVPVLADGATGFPEAAPAEEQAIMDVPEPVIADNVTSFVLDNNMLLWSRFDDPHCASHTDAPDNCIVRSRPAAGGAVRTVFDSTELAASWGIARRISADSSYVYWPYPDRVARVARNADSSSTTETVATRQQSAATIEEAAVDSSYVFWTENHRSSSPSEVRGYLYRQPKNGGTAELMGEYPGLVGSLKPDGTGGVYFIQSNFNGMLGHAFPSAGGFDSQYASASDVQSYTLDAATLFWAEASAGGRIRSVGRSSMDGVPTNLYALAPGGSPEVSTMAVDDQNLYWHEERAGSGPIFRLSRSGGAPQAITGNLLAAGGLVSNGRYLYYNEAFSIYRLSTLAAPVQLDLLADTLNMEVVQTIQSPADDVPLVAGKETFVRVHGRIVLSSEGLTEVNPYPAATLAGTRGGAPLPGSPLTPIRSNPIRSGSTDRTTLDSGFLFRLPASWTTGTVDLRAEINSNRVQAETTYANNAVTQTATFVPKRRVCLDMIPVDTTSGTIAGWDAGREQHMVRGASLMPVPSFRQVWMGGPPHRRPNVLRLFDPLMVFGSGPYTLDTDADMGYLLFNMTLDYLVRALSSQCYAVAMVPNAARFGMSAGEASPVFFFLENFSGDPRNAPRGGAAGLAHVLSHSLGRANVLCPTSAPDAPPEPDLGYPYPSCQLDNVGPNQHIGFDALTRSLILPTDGGDLMSFSFMTWTSDYTYRALFSRIPTVTSAAAADSEASSVTAGAAVQAAAPAASPAAGPQLLVSGLISGTDASETAIVNFAYVVGAESRPQVAAKIAAVTAVTQDYELRVLDEAGSVLSAAPLRASTTNSEGGTPMKLFFDLVDVNPAAVRLEVVKVRHGEIGSRTAGAGAPVVNIISPTAGAGITDTLTVAWGAADPDGDPLLFSVRYSPDSGTTWIPMGAATSDTHLVVDTTNGLPGGDQARIEVVASDGVHSTAATVGPFTVARHAPQADILSDAYGSLGTAAGAGADQHESVTLHGRGYDAEDGQLEGSALQWTVTGPVERSGDCEQLTLMGLPPGVYTVRLTVTDSDNQVGQATTQLTIAPKRVFDGDAPTLDGFCTDAVYAADTDPITLRYADELVAEVRFVHAGSSVYACFAGLPVGAAADSFAGLRFDVDNSGGTVPTPEDLGFFVGRDGVPVTVRGDGSGEFVPDELPDGLQAAVSQSDDGAYWSAELRIDASRLGGWSALVRMRATHYWRGSVGDDTAWPAESGYNAPGSWGLTALGQLSQVVDFAPLPDKMLGDPLFALAATATSGLPVAYTSLTPAVCTVADGLVTLVATGVCTVEAGQSGSAAYGSAPSVQRSFTVRGQQPPPPQQGIYLPLILR